MVAPSSNSNSNGRTSSRAGSFAGELRILAGRAREIRGAFVTLVGVEHWKHEVTETDAQGRTQTRVVRREADLPRVPIQLRGATTLAAGLRHKLPFEIPVPGLGATIRRRRRMRRDLDARGKLDVPGFDPGVALPVTIHQPTALLSAGVVPVGQFALLASRPTPPTTGSARPWPSNLSRWTSAGRSRPGSGSS